MNESNRIPLHPLIPPIKFSSQQQYNNLTEGSRIWLITFFFQLEIKARNKGRESCSKQMKGQLTRPSSAQRWGLVFALFTSRRWKDPIDGWIIFSVHQHLTNWRRSPAWYPALMCDWQGGQTVAYHGGLIVVTGVPSELWFLQPSFSGVGWRLKNNSFF